MPEALPNGPQYVIVAGFKDRTRTGKEQDAVLWRVPWGVSTNAVVSTCFCLPWRWRRRPSGCARARGAGGGLPQRPLVQPVRAAPCASMLYRGGQRGQRRMLRNRESRSEGGSKDGGGVERVPRGRRGAGRRRGGGGTWRGAARGEGWPAGGGAVVPLPATAPHTDGAPPTRHLL